MEVKSEIGHSIASPRVPINSLLIHKMVCLLPFLFSYITPKAFPSPVHPSDRDTMAITALEAIASLFKILVEISTFMGHTACPTLGWTKTLPFFEGRFFYLD